MNNKVKVVGISDTHGFFIENIPECDILCICGDISPVDDPHTVASQKKWFENTFIKHLNKYREKAKNVVFIAGNHSKYFFDCYKKDNGNYDIKKFLPKGCSYLCNDCVTIDGLKIYGNPWCNAPSWAQIGGPVWNFATHNHGFLTNLYEGIPENVDIIMTHGPAYGFCDQILDEDLLVCAFDKYKDTLKAEHLGCPALAKRIKAISGKNQDHEFTVLSAHLHSADHFGFVYENVEFYCVSMLNEQYKLGDYKPLELEF